MELRSDSVIIASSAQPYHSERGQSFLEFALMLVFILVLLAVVADLGWMFVNATSIREAAQEGAAFAAVCPTDLNKIRTRVRNSSSHPYGLNSIPDGQIVVCVMDPGTTTCGATPAVGSHVRVSVTYNHNIVTPFIGLFIGSQSYPVTGEATATILKATCATGL